MNGSSTEPNHKIRRTAGRAQSHAARGGRIWSRRVQNAAERGGRRRKIWNASKDVWKPCNSLKSHKTAKAFFGKTWSKTCDFWRSLEKGLEGAFIPPRLLPPANASDGAESSLRGASCEANPGVAFVRERRSTEAVGPAKGGLSVWKSGRPASSKGTVRRPVGNSQ
jgi:hypothetical protein